MKRIPSIILALTLLASLGLAGASCTEVVQAQTGTIEVRVTDAPPDGVTITKIEVKVTPGGVKVHRAVDGEEGKWITISITAPENKFDLLLLTGGLQQVLAMAQVTPGKYTQIRMTIEEVKVTYTKGGQTVTKTAKLPSGELKFVRPFDVVAGQPTILLLDFDADKFVNITGAGKVIVKPVVTLEIQQSAP